MHRSALIIALAIASASGCYRAHEATDVSDGGVAPALPTRFVIASFSVPAATGPSAPGANLDGRDSGTGSVSVDASCEELNPDYVGEDGTRGVDDALAQLVESLNEVLPGGSLDAAFSDGIRSGSWLIGIELRGTEIALLALEPADDYRTDGAGRPLSDQRFIVRQRIGAGSVTTGARVRAELGDIDLPLPDVAALALGSATLSRAELRFTRDASGLHDGELGASATIDDIVAEWAAVMPDVVPAIRAVLEGVADIDPGPADRQVCRSLSAGARFDAVPALVEH